jgi:hypothetical protein
VGAEAGCSLTAPSDAFSATSPWRGRIIGTLDRKTIRLAW